MTKKADRLKDEIAKTKADLSQKLSQLEAQVRQDAYDAKESLDGAIENVRATARVFSISHQVRQRPLVMAGGAMLTGLVCTRWLSGGRETRVISGPIPQPSGLVTAAAKHFPAELSLIKSLAMTAIINIVAEKAKAEAPHLVEAIRALNRKIKLEKDRRK